jgi:hypothetical protein
MTAKDLEAIYDYGYWANQRLFQVIAAHNSIVLPA